LNDTSPKLLPGDFAIWFFIFSELLVFGIFFVIYSVTRLQNVELFNEYQQTLSTESGAINTVLLITASYFVVLSIHAIREYKQQLCVRWLLAALACGVGFLVLKSFEYHSKFSAGITLDTNVFYMFYLSLTIFHFLHVILGMLILAFIAFRAFRGAYSSSDLIGLESGAAYWHMVDLVWIILFPLVYILR